MATSRSLPARPCRHHLSPEIRAAGSARRRPVLGARNRGAGGGRGRGAAVLAALVPGLRSPATWCRWGTKGIDRSRFDAARSSATRSGAPIRWRRRNGPSYLDDLRLSHNSVGAVIEVVARRAPRPGRAALWQARQRSGGGDDVDQRGQGRRDRRGHGRGGLTGVENADEIRMGPDGPGVPVEPRRRHPGRHFHRPAGGGAALR
jgi:chorismate synthase